MMNNRMDNFFDLKEASSKESKNLDRRVQLKAVDFFSQKKWWNKIVSVCVKITGTFGW